MLTVIMSGMRGMSLPFVSLFSSSFESSTKSRSYLWIRDIQHSLARTRAPTTTTCGLGIIASQERKALCCMKTVFSLQSSLGHVTIVCGRTKTLLPQYIYILIIYIYLFIYNYRYMGGRRGFVPLHTSARQPSYPPIIYYYYFFF